MIRVGDAVILRPDYEVTLGVCECLGDRFMFDGETPAWLQAALRGEPATVLGIEQECYRVRFAGKPEDAFWLMEHEILPAPPADRVL